MRGHLMQALSHLQSGRLTTLQGVSIAKYVTGPQMEIGMRHADVPLETLREWDKWLSSAIAHQAGLASAKIHMSAVTTVCTLTPMEDQYLLAKLAHVTELVTRQHQLKDHYCTIVRPLIGAISSTMMEKDMKLPTKTDLPPAASVQRAWPEITNALIEAASKGLWIEWNSKSDISKGEKVETSAVGQNHFPNLVFGGVKIPTRATHGLWGLKLTRRMPLDPYSLPGWPHHGCWPWLQGHASKQKPPIITRTARPS